MVAPLTALILNHVAKAVVVATEKSVVRAEGAVRRPQHAVGTTAVHKVCLSNIFTKNLLSSATSHVSFRMISLGRLSSLNCPY